MNLPEIEHSSLTICEHSIVKEAVAVPITKLWHNLPSLYDNIFFEADWLMQCQNCQKIIWSPPFELSEKDIVTKLKDLNIQVKGGNPRVTLRIDANHNKTEKKDQFFSSRVPRFKMKDVILPESTLLEVEEALIKVTYKDKIYKDWGFSKVDPTGEGVVLNFYGPPGTGKTRCAESFAGELEKAFILVSLAELESKFMGETAKNIANVFKIAQETEAILFFDEADNVLGRRLESVTQGIDAEINLSRSVMLKELDDFDGICIFATNFQENYDPAFVRRISHHVKFDIPDKDTLRRLWELHIVDAIPIVTPKSILIDEILDYSEGLKGGEVLMALRIALPAAIHEDGELAELKKTHLLQAIDRVRRASEEVGKTKGLQNSENRINSLLDFIFSQKGKPSNLEDARLLFNKD